jgi:hypothetical protein
MAYSKNEINVEEMCRNFSKYPGPIIHPASNAPLLGTNYM